MKFYQFRKGAQGVAPQFKYGEESINKLTGKLEGVYFNDPKEVTTKEGKLVTIPANINIKLSGDKSLSFSIETGAIFRSIINSLLSAEIGDDIEFYTYTKKSILNGEEAFFKTVSITNPSKQKTITTKEGKEITIGESLAWVIPYKDIPAVEVFKNKKGEVVSRDDSEANDFLINKLKEKFGKKDNGVSEEISIDEVPF